MDSKKLSGCIFPLAKSQWETVARVSTDSFQKRLFPITVEVDAPDPCVAEHPGCVEPVGAVDDCQISAVDQNRGPMAL
jgi:hypothetical protein